MIFNRKIDIILFFIFILLSIFFKLQKTVDGEEKKSNRFIIIEKTVK